ncbi:nuclear transport factor 2 family protein [Streptomyces sp. NPDC093085]|uniref:nuclear transport factor 2 family protein n=1 Tax=Streptomyces sp. NPDC093085 TaxID=3155068 RepID=UPI00341F073B
MSESVKALVSAGIRTVIGAHAQAQDAARTDELVALYTPDAVLEVPGLPPVEGRDALRAAFTGWAPATPQLHLVSNIVITSWTENEATAVSDVAFLQRGESGWQVRLVGRYDDTLTHHDGAWRFRRRATTYQR